MEEEVSEKEASKETEVDDATLEIETRQRLWSLDDRIQKGHIDLKEIPSNGRLASRGPPKPDPSNTSKNACDNDSDEEEDPRQNQNVVNASPSKKNKPDELEREHNGPASAKSTSIGLASRANQTSKGDATKQTGLTTSPFPVPDSKSQDTGNGNSAERKPSESLHSTSVNQQSPTLCGRPPPVPQAAYL
ncbi:hypothetical protein OEA41_009850 [Lepraria neglecta]|uniref:Uncharacterized protein n=1 Tax=Lepraria neglecta TaxID=209136 RepID=A0AAD9YW75_9LECA|nr:hypothetical protein OEA41_009850 [Lepraria neglecta]